MSSMARGSFASRLAPALLFVCSFVAGQSAAQSLAKQAFDEWMQAFNSGDKAAMEAFDQAWRPPSPLARLMDFRRRTGGFKVLRVEKEDPLSMAVLLEERNSDTVARLVVSAKEDGGKKIDQMSLLAIPRPPDLAIPRLSEGEAIQAAVAYADRAAAEDRFSGAMLIAKNGEILIERAWGKADRDRDVAATVNTQFRLGSMNKMFTAVAVLQLVQAGKVKLDEPMATYIPDYPNTDLASKVTIRQLLTHTGGTGNIFGPEFNQNRTTLKEHSDYIKLFGNRPQETTGVGTFRYSNYGFVLLGAVIEKVTGQTYYDYVEQQIFKPAGMKSTASLPESDVVPGRADGYTWREGKWASNATTLPWRGMAAGGGYSTVGDMLRFATALQAGKLLSPELVAMATQEQISAYGFGFGVGPPASPRRFGHTGGAAGMNGELRVYPESGYVIVVLSNLDPPAATNLSGYVTARLPLDATGSKP